MTEVELITACKRKKPAAQKLMYDRYSARMLGVCSRYVRDRSEAEDLMVQGMFKALTRINQYKGEGNLDAWLRRIMVNESLMFLRKKRESFVEPEEMANKLPVHPMVHEGFEARRILALLDKLPLGYRTVFNLYAIEGYKHREIADMLGISINTSKSQLLLARKKLQKMLT